MFMVHSEFNDAHISIELKKLEDGYIVVDYKFAEIGIHEINWESFGNIAEEVSLNKKQLYYISQEMNGHNWTIYLKDPNDGDGVIFEEYGHQGPSYHLDTIAECYDDCEVCDKCHNPSQSIDWEWDYCKYECKGCSAHPCSHINGRDEIERAKKALL